MTSSVTSQEDTLYISRKIYRRLTVYNRTERRAERERESGHVQPGGMQHFPRLDENNDGISLTNGPLPADSSNEIPFRRASSYRAGDTFAKKTLSLRGHCETCSPPPPPSLVLREIYSSVSPSCRKPPPRNAFLPEKLADVAHDVELSLWVLFSLPHVPRPSCLGKFPCARQGKRGSFPLSEKRRFSHFLNRYLFYAGSRGTTRCFCPDYVCLERRVHLGNRYFVRETFLETVGIV